MLIKRQSIPLVTNPSLRRGNTPVFFNIVREIVLDIALCSSSFSGNIANWKVSDEKSLSDHRQIIFGLAAGDILKETFRDPRKTNWNIYCSKNECQNKLSFNKINYYMFWTWKSSWLSNYCTYESFQRMLSDKSALFKQRRCLVDRLEKLRKNARKQFSRAKLTSNLAPYTTS